MTKTRFYSRAVIASLVLMKTAVVILLFTGCTSAPDVRVDQQPAANLSQYKTFSFYDQLSTDRSTYTSIMSSRLKQSTRDELERHLQARRERVAALEWHAPEVQVEHGLILGAPRSKIALGHAELVQIRRERRSHREGLILHSV